MATYTPAQLQEAIAAAAAETGAPAAPTERVSATMVKAKAKSGLTL